MGRIVRARVDNEERAVEAESDLERLVRVGVVDERAAPWRRERCHERISGRDHRRGARRRSAVPGNTVAIGWDLDPVPVYARRGTQVIDNRYAHRLASLEYEQRARRRDRVGWRWRGAVLLYERDLIEAPLVSFCRRLR